jgi:hypothetical protein
MSHEQKIVKYKDKLFFLKNQVGGMDCDIRYMQDIHSSTYIKDITNFIPFEKSVFHPLRKHPVCSYSIWDKNHIQLYVPTQPEPTDKLYQSQKYYIRLFNAFNKNAMKGAVAEELHLIMWSYKHSKWYSIENWPKDDLLIDEFFDFLNVTSQFQAKLVINNLYIFRKEFDHNPGAIQENVRQITELLDDNNRQPSDEVLAELARYSPPLEVVDIDEHELPRF